MPDTIAALPAVFQVTTAPEITAWPYEFPLSHTIDVAGDTLGVLILKEPTAKEVFQFGLLTGLMEHQVRGLVAQLAETPPPIIDKIAGVDIIALSVRLNRFFSRAAA